MSARLMGVLILLVGAAVAYWGVWMPLQQAQAGVASITLPGGIKLALLVPMCVVFGIGYVVGGGSFHQRMQNTDPDKVRRWGKTSGTGWLLLLVSFAAAFALHQWMQNTLRALGYGYAG
ncbi:hypothetical protein QSH46_018060 [Xanthomonas arboricola pv. juglandis]|nr:MULTISPECIES: hypothetical protein [Xanthomonas]KOA97426.1 hypothetical protein AE921_17390 [Xanthomonas arboricola]KOB06034.1 hypothetical protein AE922_16515 [Xanthomonas arboricola]KOB08950.1 hypothetical protein AE923_09595 [Xanthomonas arboricola]KOB19134.1 hypothetical protein AE925_09355 [Xanthomonas arboricola]KOB24869.1 hypothetical protein AE926_05775 [Xanthomonas arboricola]